MGKRQQTRGIKSLDDLDVIVDGDAHILESLEEILEYMENDVSKKFISSASDPTSMIYTAGLSGTLPSYYDTDDDIAGLSEGVIEKKLKEQDDFDIDYGVLGPTLNLALPTVNNDRHAVALAQAYNSFVMDKVAGKTDALTAAIIVPGQVPDKAAELIDRFGDEADAVQMPPSGLMPPIGYEKYDLIYEAAAKKDLPVVLHAGANNMTFPIQFKYCQTHPESMITNFPFSLMWHLTSLIYHGAAERHPDVDFVFQEAGLGWAPYTKFRMDDYYLAEGEYLPWMDKLPSDYMDEQVYFTTQPLGHTKDRPEFIANFVEMAGTGNVLFSSDLPHHDFDTPEELFDRLKGNLDDEDIRAVMGENAAKVFGFSY